MDKIASKNRTFHLLERYKIREKKRFGQNFLIDSKITTAIVANAKITKNIGVIEIGPGLGALSEELLNASSRVVSIEIDNKLTDLLQENFKDRDNFTLISQDFLKVDLNQLVEEYFLDFEEVYVVSNLPYYITTNIISKIIETKNTKIKHLILMMQKEVGKKLTKKSDEVDSYLKYLIDISGEAKVLLHVSKNDFHPRPKIDSIVIDIELNKEVNQNAVDFVKQAFTNKRKTLLNNFKDDEEISLKLTSALKELDLNEMIRIEELTYKDIEDIVKIIY